MVEGNYGARRQAVIPRGGAVWSRWLAAVIVGYGVGALWAAALAMGLPLIFSVSVSEAVLCGMLLSVPIWIGLWMMAFAVGKAWRAWAIMGFAAASAGIILALSYRVSASAVDNVLPGAGGI